MPKGVRNQYGLGEEVLELNRMLKACERKSLNVTQKLAEQTPDSQLKESLVAFLGKNGLMAMEATKPSPVQPAPPTEREQQLGRIGKQLMALPDASLTTLLDIAKSMNRTQKDPGSKSPKETNRKRKKGAGETPPPPKSSQPGSSVKDVDAANGVDSNGA